MLIADWLQLNTALYCSLSFCLCVEHFHVATECKWVLKCTKNKKILLTNECVQKSKK